MVDAMSERAGMDQVAFNADGLVPAVAQDHVSGKVLMVAWMNEEALRLTVESGQAHFWSRSRRCLWHKGATSGSFMNVLEIRLDCDGDTLLLSVAPEGPACHTGRRSCFYRPLVAGVDHEPSADGDDDHARGAVVAPTTLPSDQARSVIDELFDVILDRRNHRPVGSYTAELLDSGEDRILKKVGEEAMEVVLAAKGEGDVRLVSEVADLAYHVLVLLASRGLKPADVGTELRSRRNG